MRPWENGFFSRFCFGPASSPTFSALSNLGKWTPSKSSRMRCHCLKIRRNRSYYSLNYESIWSCSLAPSPFSAPPCSQMLWHRRTLLSSGGSWTFCTMVYPAHLSQSKAKPNVSFDYWTSSCGRLMFPSRSCCPDTGRPQRTDE